MVQISVLHSRRQGGEADGQSCGAGCREGSAEVLAQVPVSCSEPTRRRGCSPGHQGRHRGTKGPHKLGPSAEAAQEPEFCGTGSSLWKGSGRRAEGRTSAQGGAWPSLCCTRSGHPQGQVTTGLRAAQGLKSSPGGHVCRANEARKWSLGPPTSGKEARKCRAPAAHRSSARAQAHMPHTECVPAREPAGEVTWQRQGPRVLERRGHGCGRKDPRGFVAQGE